MKQTHVTLLAWLHIALSASGILAAMIVFVAVAGGGLISGDRTAIAVTSLVATSVGGLLVLLSAPGLAAGIGLLQHRPWARILALILGILQLFNFPIGTALGVYTLYVLLDDGTTTKSAEPVMA